MTVNTVSGKGRRALVITLRIILGLLAFASYTFAIFLGTKTLTTLWIPWVVTAAVALATGLHLAPLCRVFTGSTRFILNYDIYSFISTGVLTGLFFSLNYFLSDPSSACGVNADVTRIYSETRYHTRRVGRRVVGRGNPYKVYNADVVLPGGRTKTIPLTLSEYNSSRHSTVMTVEVEKGFFGLPVIKHTSLVPPPKEARRFPRRDMSE